MSFALWDENVDNNEDEYQMNEYFLPPLLELHTIMQQIYTDAIHMRLMDDGLQSGEDYEILFDKLLKCQQMEVALELFFTEDDAIDFISGDSFEDGMDAYIMDDTFNHPISYDTLKTMIVEHKQIKNPFTREDIQRFLKIKIKHEK